MGKYFEHEVLRGFYLEDSWVLDISASRGQLVITADGNIDSLIIEGDHYTDEGNLGKIDLHAASIRVALVTDGTILTSHDAAADL